MTDADDMLLDTPTVIDLSDRHAQERIEARNQRRSEGDPRAELEALREVVRLLRVDAGIRPYRGKATWCVWALSAWPTPATREQVDAVHRAQEVSS